MPARTIKRTTTTTNQRAREGNDTMKATIEKQSDGTEVLVLRLNVIKPPRLSNSGKVLLVASESAKTDLTVNGKVL